MKKKINIVPTHLYLRVNNGDFPSRNFTKFAIHFVLIKMHTAPNQYNNHLRFRHLNRSKPESVSIINAMLNV